MAQTMYNRPWPRWVPVVAVALFTAVVIGLAIAYGARKPLVWIFLGIDALVLFFFLILDPETTVESQGVLPGGTPVRVRRPLVGFKRLERSVGVTGGYEVRIDGYRYERAYVRL